MAQQRQRLRLTCRPGRPTDADIDAALGRVLARLPGWSECVAEPRYKQRKGRHAFFSVASAAPAGDAASRDQANAGESFAAVDAAATAAAEGTRTPSGQREDLCESVGAGAFDTATGHSLEVWEERPAAPTGRSAGDGATAAGEEYGCAGAVLILYGLCRFPRCVKPAHIARSIARSITLSLTHALTHSLTRSLTRNNAGVTPDLASY
jgi:hypothetical protein